VVKYDGTLARGGRATALAKDEDERRDCCEVKLVAMPQA
jgi:hypothetical protein